LVILNKIIVLSSNFTKGSKDITTKSQASGAINFKGDEYLETKSAFIIKAFLAPPSPPLLDKL
jgi:hypothetical protein